MKYGRVGVLVVAALFCTPAVAQVGVSPPKFDLRLDDGPTTETVRLFNYGSRPVQIEVLVHNWTLDERNRVVHLPPAEQSLDQWLVINPLRFVVEPGRSQAVRFSVRPKVRPEPGEHRAMIYFKQRPDPQADPSTMQTLFNMGVAVYATAGEIVRRGTVSEVNVRDGSMMYEVASQGSAHVRLHGEYRIETVSRQAEPVAEWLAEATPQGSVVVRGELPTTPVLPGTRRRFELPVRAALGPGDYVLVLEALLGDDPVTRRVPFSVDRGRDLVDTATSQ